MRSTARSSAGLIVSSDSTGGSFFPGIGFSSRRTESRPGETPLQCRLPLGGSWPGLQIRRNRDRLFAPPTRLEDELIMVTREDRRHSMPPRQLRHRTRSPALNDPLLENVLRHFIAAAFPGCDGLAFRNFLPIEEDGELPANAAEAQRYRIPPQILLLRNRHVVGHSDEAPIDAGNDAGSLEVGTVAARHSAMAGDAPASAATAKKIERTTPKFIPSPLRYPDYCCRESVDEGCEGNGGIGVGIGGQGAKIDSRLLMDFRVRCA